MKSALFSLKQKFKSKAMMAFGGTALVAAMALAPAAGAAPLDLSGVTTGLNVTDAIGTGVSFLGIFGDWVYFVLGGIIAIALIGIIIWLVGLMPKGKKKSA